MKFFSIMDSIADNDIKDLRDNLESTLNIQINDKEIDELLLLDDTKILDAVWDLTYKKCDPPLRSFKANGIEIELDKINDDFKNHVIFSSFYSMKCAANIKENFINIDNYIYDRYYSFIGNNYIHNSMLHYKASSKLWCEVNKDLGNVIDCENFLGCILRGCINFKENEYKMEFLSKEIFYIIIKNWGICPYNPINIAGIDFELLRTFSEKVMEVFSNRLAGIIKKRQKLEINIKEFVEYSSADKLNHYYISERLFHFSLFYQLLQIPAKCKDITSAELDTDTIISIIDVLTEIKDIPCIFSIEKYISNMLSLYFNEFKQDYYGWRFYVQITINYLSNCVFPVYESTYYAILLIYINKKKNSFKLSSNNQQVITDKIMKILEGYIEINLQPAQYEQQMETLQDFKIKNSNKYLQDLSLNITHKLYNHRENDNKIFRAKSIEQFSQKLYLEKLFDSFKEIPNRFEITANQIKALNFKRKNIAKNKNKNTGQIL